MALGLGPGFALAGGVERRSSSVAAARVGFLVRVDLRVLAIGLGVVLGEALDELAVLLEALLAEAGDLALGPVRFEAFFRPLFAGVGVLGASGADSISSF